MYENSKIDFNLNLYPFCFLAAFSAFLFVFLLCVQLSLNSNSGDESGNRLHLNSNPKHLDLNLAPGAAAFIAAKSGGKRLHAASLAVAPNNDGVYEAGSADVFDPVNRGVQFGDGKGQAHGVSSSMLPHVSSPSVSAVR